MRSRQAADGDVCHPEGVKTSLKAELDLVMRAPELTAEDRSRCVTNSRWFCVRRNAAGGKGSARSGGAGHHCFGQGADATRQCDGKQQEKVNQLMDRFNSLMSEGRYLLAEEGPAAEVQAIESRGPDRNRRHALRPHGALQQVNMQYRELRQRGVVDTLAQAEICLGAVPGRSSHRLSGQGILAGDDAAAQEVRLGRPEEAKPGRDKIRKGSMKPQTWNSSKRR